MKYLVNADFQILRRGEYVKADKSVGEWIYDSENTNLSLSNLKELAECNKISITATKKADYQNNLNQEILKMSTAEQNQPTQTEIVEQIVREGYQSGKDEDAMLIAIVQAGIGFRVAGKMFKEACERLGFTKSTKDVKALAQRLLAEIEFKAANHEEVEKAIDLVLSQAGEGAERGQAVSAVKFYAKQNEIALPAAPKGETGAGGFRGRVYQFILDNPNASKDDLQAYIAKNGKAEKAEKLVKAYFPVLKLCRKFANKHGQSEFA